MRLGYRAGGGRFQDVLDVAVAIELAQLASMVVDDAIDRSEIRHGWSAFKTFGPSISLLAGELLKSSASSLMSQALEVSTRFVKQLEALRRFELTYMKVCTAQLLDLWHESCADVSEKQYFRMVDFGTGGFLEGAITVGLLLSGAEEPMANHLRRYARFLGVAFQIYDDVFDLFVHPLGEKEFANDIKRRKQRLPLVHFLHHCSEQERREVHRVFKKPTISDADARRLVRLMIERGSVEYSLKKAREFCSRAEFEASKAAPPRDMDLYIGLIELIQEDDNIENLPLGVGHVVRVP